MKRPYSYEKRQSGMSLIEVLVSLLIFSFAFLGLIALQARAVQASTDAEDRSRASLLANEIISTMWTQKNLSLPPATTAAWEARVRDEAVSGLPGSRGDISLPDANGVVTVEIIWRAPFRKVSDQDSRYKTQVTMP
ncbi:MAG: type IV pilus modification protein PilV [Pseudomonadota bacterium]